MKPCWRVTYYFTQGHKKQLLRGVFCGCMPGNTREDAIAQVSPVEVQPNCKLVKVCAKRSKPGHYCFVNEVAP